MPDHCLPSPWSSCLDLYIPLPYHTTTCLTTHLIHTYLVCLPANLPSGLPPLDSQFGFYLLPSPCGTILRICLPFCALGGRFWMYSALYPHTTCPCPLLSASLPTFACQAIHTATAATHLPTGLQAMPAPWTSYLPAWD